MRAFVLSLGDHEISLTPGSWRIGRDPRCELRVHDESVSRTHATLRVTSEGVELTDHGSRNGVRVNGERVEGTVPLNPGDVLEVGTAQFRLLRQAAVRSEEAARTQPLPRVPRLASPELALLSQRERKVFEALARGLTQREVAKSLGLSVKTIETYRSRIGEKLRVRTRAELVEYALRAGILATRERAAPSQIVGAETLPESPPPAPESQPAEEP